MKIIFINLYSMKYSILMLSALLGFSAQAFVGHSLKAQDKIMNEAMSSVDFNDVVRSVKILEDGRLEVTFKKHAAIYTVENFKAGDFLKKLEDSRTKGEPVQISVSPKDNKLIYIK